MLLFFAINSGGSPQKIIITLRYVRLPQKLCLLPFEALRLLTTAIGSLGHKHILSAPMLSLAVQTAGMILKRAADSSLHRRNVFVTG